MAGVRGAGAARVANAAAAAETSGEAAEAAAAEAAAEAAEAEAVAEAVAEAAAEAAALETEAEGAAARLLRVGRRRGGATRFGSAALAPSRTSPAPAPVGCARSRGRVTLRRAVPMPATAWRVSGGPLRRRMTTLQRSRTREKSTESVRGDRVLSVLASVQSYLEGMCDLSVSHAHRCGTRPAV